MTGPACVSYEGPDCPVVVAATVTSGTLKARGSSWNRVVEQWGTRRLDEPAPSEIKQLMACTRASAVP